MNYQKQYTDLLTERTRLCYELLRVDAQFQQVQEFVKPDERPCGTVGRVGITALPIVKRSSEAVAGNMDRRFPPEWHGVAQRLGLPVYRRLSDLVNDRR